MRPDKLLAVCVAGAGVWALALGFVVLGLFAALVGWAWALAGEQD